MVSVMARYAHVMVRRMVHIPPLRVCVRYVAFVLAMKEVC